MKQILAAATASILGLALFAGMMWLIIYATALEEAITDPTLRFAVDFLVWIAALITLGAVSYIIYLVYKQYTDPNMSYSELRKKKALYNPEFD